LNKPRRIEVQQQTQPFVGEVQVRQQLGDVNWQDFFSRFDLDNDFIFDDQIEPALSELMRETRFVDALKQAWSKLPVHADGVRENATRECVERVPVEPLRLCVFAARI
jgi:hypothetical protein